MLTWVQSRINALTFVASSVSLCSSIHECDASFLPIHEIVLALSATVHPVDVIKSTATPLSQLLLQYLHLNVSLNPTF